MTDKTADEILDIYTDLLEPHLMRMTEYALVYGVADVRSAK